MKAEVPSMAMGDIAFNLLIFFVVLADPTSETGRPQQVPSSTNEKSTDQPGQNIEVVLRDPDKSNNTVNVNGAPVGLADLPGKLKPLLESKTKPEERIVVVRSSKDTPYRWWIAVTAKVEQAGGVVAMQVEEEREVKVQ